MSSCSGNPSNCGFCGVQSTEHGCAKTDVAGCAANPSQCTACQGNGCLATECTGNPGTCKACTAGHFSSCRKAELSATEGIERVRS
ncbi:uncharacterized protein EHS24_001062 [Apiotrichum porosum]|uniref:Uncharacterized protein n=1 Tax=Apiotrichum porosum TaxID=105984 RepID=A0A427YC20_9TREE|nr:uncharacterized protein EHS24_001062 [Apiotrichum porosum]RSH88517.1 hypothetical protein EHS24_001062 [Apiotrichum porosum]